MATFYNAMLYGGLLLAVIFAIIAVILFIKLKIPKVIGDLTGSTAKKQIQEIREKGYESVQGAGASKKDAIKSATNTGRISARDIKSSSQKAAESGRVKYENAINALQKKEEADNYIKSINEDATDVLSNEFEDATDVLSEEYEEDATDVLSEGYEEDATDVLSEGYEEDATDVLSEGYEEGATDVLSEGDADATDILSADDTDATDVLSSEGTNELRSKSGMSDMKNKEKSLKVLMDVVVVHTDESI